MSNITIKKGIKEAMNQTIEIYILNTPSWVEDSIFNWFICGLVFGNFKEAKLFCKFVKPKIILSLTGKKEN